MSVSLIVVLVVAFVAVKMIARHGWRAAFTGLGALAAMGFIFLLIVRSTKVDRSVARFQERQAQQMAQDQQMHAEERARAAADQARSLARGNETRFAVAPPASSPPKRSAAPSKQPQSGIAESLTKALQNALNDPTAAPVVILVAADSVPPAAAASLPGAPAPVVILVAADSVRVLRNALSNRPSAQKTPVKPAVKEPAPAVAAADAPAPTPRPAWVDAAPKMDGDAYVMAKQVGPYTALPECERELPRILEQAVAEYAELLLGRDKARDVHLPDDVLEGLVRQRWTEHLAQEFGGAVQDMAVLHVLIGLDPLAQERIREASDHSVAVRRMQGAGVALGGVLGLLALAWCGLSVFGGRQEPKPPQEAVAAAPRKKWPQAATAIFVVALLAALLVGARFFSIPPTLAPIKPHLTQPLY